MKKIKRLLKRLLRLFHIEIRYINRALPGYVEFHNDLNENLAYEFNDEALHAIRIVRKHTMSPYVNLELLYEQVIYCEKNGITGDLIECGVWKGGAVGIMALANLKYGKQRRSIRLFDIFDDICEPDPDKDGPQAAKEFYKLTGRFRSYSGKLKSVKGVYDSLGGAGTLDENRTLLEKIIGYPGDKIHYYQGWFQKTVPRATSDIYEIAILRLDGDLYASIKICIDNLYDKIVRGGIIIIDDYGCYEGCRRAVDEFRAERGISAFMNYSNANCRYWIKD